MENSQFDHSQPNTSRACGRDPKDVRQAVAGLMDEAGDKDLTKSRMVELICKHSDNDPIKCALIGLAIGAKVPDL